jgi:DNA-binding transcriptional MerR regulator/methylmalonyl-CoA mutase cobalamin-binding subunit
VSESAGLLRIGELSRRSGVSPELLRAWERRYGLLEPTRSTGGLRLYSAADLDRVRAMQQHLAEGLAAAEAAALAAAAEPRADQAVAFSPAAARRDLDVSLSAFDEARAHAVLDELLSTATLDSILSDVLIPFLRELGKRWERGEITVAQEHFASSVLRGRLLGLARGWDRGIGPRVLLSCAPGEQHDLGLVAFGLALRARGFRILYLGADTPIESVAEAARAAHPHAVVVSAVSAERFKEIAGALRELAAEYPVYLGGAGATAVGGEFPTLTGDPVEEADRFAALMQ